MLNRSSIESSAKATVSIAVVGKVFYLTNFNGSKRSALYRFYRTVIQVPLCYEPRLGLTDDYSLSKMPSGYVRYLSELFLIFKPQLRTTARFTVHERTPQSSDFVIANDISAQGSGMFAFYKRTWQGTLTISDEGTIRKIVVHAPLRGRRPEPIGLARHFGLILKEVFNIRCDGFVERSHERPGVCAKEGESG